jgi:hypothetical protein
MKAILRGWYFCSLFILVFTIPPCALAATITAIASGNWSATAWPNTTRLGNISSSSGSPIITGAGTSFLTQVSVGNILKDAGNVVIGTVLSINNATSITLTANAISSNTSIPYNVQGIGPGDAAIIPGGIDVTVDQAGLKCTTLGIGISGTGNASLIFNAGTQLTASAVVTVGSVGHSGSITMTNGGILTSKGFVISNAGSWAPGAGTIELNGPNSIPTTFFAGHFNNLTVSGQTTSTSGAIIIDGNLNIPDGGGGGSVFSTGYATTVTGTTTVGGQPSGSAFLNFTAATGAKIFNGLVTIGNGGTWDNSLINSPVEFHGGINSSGDFLAGTDIQTFNTNNQTFSGSMTIPTITVSGVILNNNSLLTIGTALNGTGTLAQGVNATLNINFTGTAAISHIIASATGNLVNYGAPGPQTVFPTNYYYLTLSNAGLKTLQAGTNSIAADLTVKGSASSIGISDLAISGNLITTANASFDAGAFDVSIAGYLSNAGSFNGPTGSTVHVGLDLMNKGSFNAGAASVAQVAGNVFNTGTFNGGPGSFLYIGGNASNTGTLNAGTNTIEFDGYILQTLTNTGAGQLNNITVNNIADGLQFETDITVPSVLNMIQGNIDLNGHHLQVGVSTANPGTLTYNSGTIFGAGSIERWFDSSPIADGTGAGLFPVGTVTDYRPFYVSTPTGPTTGGSMTLNYNDAVGTTAVSIPDSDRVIESLYNPNWNLMTGDGLSGGSYNLRIEGTGYGTIGDVNDLRIALADRVVGSAGTNGGTLTDPQVNRTNISLADLTNTFFLGFSSGTVLPISLLYFKATPVNTEVKLDWETSMEIDNDHFTVLRSTTLSVWEVIARVSGSFHTGINSEYEAMDKNPLPGLSYYKLQQTDRDGKTNNSGIVSVHFGQTSTILVYPNPTADLIFITTPNAGTIEFGLLGSTGQLIPVQSDVSAARIILHVSGLAAGMYYIQTKCAGMQETFPIIKK